MTPTPEKKPRYWTKWGCLPVACLGTLVVLGTAAWFLMP